MKERHRVGDFTSAALDGLNSLVDANTVIGEPITTPAGVVIIPVSKVSFGYASGGSDLPASRPDLFGAATGGGVTIQPLAFLVVDGADVQLLQMQTADSTGDRIVNAVPGVLDKLLDLIPKKDKKSGEGEATEE
ncbi:MAG: sporulation protein YtfJ [Oscillospiraceae bacterium]|nr:sporulation protein YtfJ [Oscillospiraceae bacterium]